MVTVRMHGTDGARDFRAVSCLNIFVLFAVTFLQICWNTTLDSQPAIPLICSATSFFYSFGSSIHANVVASIMFGLTAFYLTVISHTFADHKHVKVLIFFFLTCVLIPHLVLIGYIIFEVFLKRNNFVNVLFNKAKPSTFCFNCKSLNSFDPEHEDSQLLE